MKKIQIHFSTEIKLKHQRLRQVFWAMIIDEKICKAVFQNENTIECEESLIWQPIFLVLKKLKKTSLQDTSGIIMKLFSAPKKLNQYTQLRKLIENDLHAEDYKMKWKMYEGVLDFLFLSSQVENNLTVNTLFENSKRKIWTFRIKGS